MKKIVLIGLLALSNLGSAASQNLQIPLSRTKDQTSWSNWNLVNNSLSKINKIQTTTSSTLSSLWSSVTKWVPSQIKEHPILATSITFGTAAALWGFAKYRASWQKQVKLENLEKNNKQLQETLAQKEADIVKLQEQLEDQKTATAGFWDTQEKTAAEAHIKELTVAIQTKTDKLKQLQATAQKQENQINLQREEIETKQETIQSLTQTNTNQTGELTENRNTLKQKETELKNLQNSLKEKTDAQQKTMTEHASAQAEQKKLLEQLQKENETLQKKIKTKKTNASRETQTASQQEEKSCQSDAEWNMQPQEESSITDEIKSLVKENHKLHLQLFIEKNKEQISHANTTAQELLQSADKDSLDAFINKNQKLVTEIESMLEAATRFEDTEDSFEGLDSFITSADKLRQHMETATMLLESFPEDLSVSTINTETNPELTQLQAKIIDDTQLTRHINKYIAKYKEITKKEKLDIDIQIRKWIIAGGKIWNNLLKKDSLDTKEITELFWFLYTQGLLQGLDRTGPNNYSYVLTGATSGDDYERKGEKLFTLLAANQKAKDRLATHLEEEDGFKNRQVKEVALWNDSKDLFLPVGMKTILFIKAEYSIATQQGIPETKNVYLFKPEDAAGEIALTKECFKHGLNTIWSRVTKKFNPGLDNHPSTNKERIPQILNDTKTPIFANKNESETIKQFYGHLDDTQRRIGNEISINKITDKAAAWYSSLDTNQTNTTDNDNSSLLSSSTPSTMQGSDSKEQLEKVYKTNRCKSMYAWAGYYFGPDKTMRGRDTMYNNTVAEVYSKTEERKDWLDEKNKKKHINQTINTPPNQNLNQISNLRNALLENKDDEDSLLGSDYSKDDERNPSNLIISNSSSEGSDL